jgi:hypothetical protein
VQSDAVLEVGAPPQILFAHGNQFVAEIFVDHEVDFTWGISLAPCQIVSARRRTNLTVNHISSNIEI